MWPSIRKHVLSTKAFPRGFEVALKPFGNPVSEGLKPIKKPFGNPLETLWNPLETLWNPLETLWDPSETLWKPSWNPLETLWKRFETLLKRFETLRKPFWNALKLFGMQNTLNPLRKLMFRILFENPIWKCRGKNILPVCVRWRMRDSTACYLYIYIFLQKCYFAAWLGTDLFIVVGRSKDITHVKVLLSLVAKIADVTRIGYCLHAEINDTHHLNICVRCDLFFWIVCLLLRNSAYVSLN